MCEGRRSACAVKRHNPPSSASPGRRLNPVCWRLRLQFAQKGDGGAGRCAPVRVRREWCFSTLASRCASRGPCCGLHREQGRRAGEQPPSDTEAAVRRALWLRRQSCDRESTGSRASLGRISRRPRWCLCTRFVPASRVALLLLVPSGSHPRRRPRARFGRASVVSANGVSVLASPGVSGSAGALPLMLAVAVAHSCRPALADISGARRMWTVAMISSGSMPCR
jgi:hypothetical protein